MSLGRASDSFSEMVYLQTSKGVYETGEDLWFKAYILDAQTLTLSNRDQTLYIQMLNESDGKIVWQEKYLIEDGIASGHIYVGEDLADGDYFLEGYTSHSFFADSTQMNAIRKVRILKNIIQNEQTTVTQSKNLCFEVFPEGGNLVSGISSKLAFKAKDEFGYPVNVSGVLYENSTPLLSFESIHAGMGFMQFTPLKDKSYHICLSSGDTIFLPDIYPQGMTIQLSKNGPEYVEFVVSQSHGLSDQTVYLVGQMRGVTYCVAKGFLKDKLKIKIPLNEFPLQGIAEFTLFDDRMMAMATRLVYVHPSKRLNITVELDQKNYVIREKASVKIRVTDDTGAPIVANLAISIFDKLYANQSDPVNILTYCHLSSQIRGRIYNPAYYFDNDNPKRLPALDLLLLTQGWSRYVWEANAGIQERTSVISDNITGVQTVKNKKMRNVEQFIQVSDADGKSQLVWVDSIGCFAIDSEHLRTLEPGYLYLKPMLPKNFGPDIHINDPFSLINTIRPSKKVFYPFLTVDDIPIEEELFRPYIASRDSVIMLDEVSITAKSRKPFRDKFMGRLDSLTQRDLGPWVCSHGFLQNYREGYDHCSHFPYTGGNKDTIIKYMPIEGESYSVIKHENYIVVDLYKTVYRAPYYSDEELLRINNLWCTKGYYGVREFYQPDELEISSPFPDARNTLLWLPSVITDSNGEAIVSFYCSDINTQFVGKIEGIDNTGLLGASEFEFMVRKFR